MGETQCWPPNFDRPAATHRSDRTFHVSCCAHLGFCPGALQLTQRTCVCCGCCGLAKFQAPTHVRAEIAQLRHRDVVHVVVAAFDAQLPIEPPFHVRAYLT
jgi:hypothetical protein